MEKMFRRRKRVLSQEELDKNLERLGNRIPGFIIEQLAEELKGKEITAEKFERLIEEVEQKGLTEKVENLSEQISSITDRMKITKTIANREEFSWKHSLFLWFMVVFGMYGIPTLLFVVTKMDQLCIFRTV